MALWILDISVTVTRTILLVKPVAHTINTTCCLRDNDHAIHEVCPPCNYEGRISTAFVAVLMTIFLQQCSTYVQTCARVDIINN